VGEAAFDQVRGLGDGFAGWGQEEVDVVGHDDEGHFVTYTCFAWSFRWSAWDFWVA
jgi:hypothetical protein